MRRITALVALTLLGSTLCFGATLTGYISDEECARNGEERNPTCAKNCVQKNGATAVVVTDDGKIYSIADQEKVRKFAGETVAVTGEVQGESIKSVDSAVPCRDSDLCKG